MVDEQNNNELDNIKDSNKDIPKEPKKIVEQQIFGMKMMSGFRQPIDPLLDKMNSEHITTLLIQKEEDSKREFQKSIINMIFTAFIILLIFALIIFFTKTLANTNPVLYKEIIKDTLITLISLVGGYGFGYSKGKREFFNDNE